MGVIYSDDFSGSSDGTLLTTHNPAWTETASSGGHGTIRSGVCYDPGAHFTLNVLTGIVPPSADYAVEAVFARKANLTRNIYLCVRCSADGNTYYAFYHQRSGSAILRKTIDGSSTTLGEVVRNIPENGSETWRIAIEGTRILCSIDGATVFDVDDTAISSGLVGLHFYTYPYDSSLDGTVAESFRVETLAAPVQDAVQLTGAGAAPPATGRGTLGGAQAELRMNGTAGAAAGRGALGADAARLHMRGVSGCPRGAGSAGGAPAQLYLQGMAGAAAGAGVLTAAGGLLQGRGRTGRVRAGGRLLPDVAQQPELSLLGRDFLAALGASGTTAEDVVVTLASGRPVQCRAFVQETGCDAPRWVPGRLADFEAQWFVVHLLARDLPPLTYDRRLQGTVLCSDGRHGELRSWRGIGRPADVLQLACTYSEQAGVYR